MLYKEVLERGIYISDVFLGYRQVPHLVIAVKREFGSGLNYVLRATLETRALQGLLTNLEASGFGEAFIVNHEGILQTPSRSHGEASRRFRSYPKYSKDTEVLEDQLSASEKLVVGYAYIDDTPFILMIV